MSAMSSELAIAPARSLPAALDRPEPAEGGRRHARTTLCAIVQQVRALLLAQRSLSGQFGSAAYLAEDDYHRFSNRQPD
jgi:hypothetical protein